MFCPLFCGRCRQPVASHARQWTDELRRRLVFLLCGICMFDGQRLTSFCRCTCSCRCTCMLGYYQLALNFAWASLDEPAHLCPPIVRCLPHSLVSYEWEWLISRSCALNTSRVRVFLIPPTSTVYVERSFTNGGRCLYVSDLGQTLSAIITKLLRNNCALLFALILPSFGERIYLHRVTYKK